MNTNRTFIPRTVRQSDVARHISSFSTDSAGQCVEAGPLLDNPHRHAVRSSHRGHGALMFTDGAWSAFTGAIKTDAIPTP